MARINGLGGVRPAVWAVILTRSNHKSYAVMSGEDSSLATDSRALIATQGSSRGTWRLLCGSYAHKWLHFSCESNALASDVVSYPPRIYKREIWPTLIKKNRN